MNTLEQRSQQMILINSELAQHKTNHVLHLIITILSVGLWSFIWIVASASTAEEQNKIRRKYEIKEKFNLAGAILAAWVGVVVVAIATVNV